MIGSDEKKNKKFKIGDNVRKVVKKVKSSKKEE